MTVNLNVLSLFLHEIQDMYILNGHGRRASKEPQLPCETEQGTARGSYSHKMDKTIDEETSKEVKNNKP